VLGCRNASKQRQPKLRKCGKERSNSEIANTHVRRAEQIGDHVRPMKNRAQGISSANPILTIFREIERIVRDVRRTDS